MTNQKLTTNIVPSILIKLPFFLLAAFCYVVVVITSRVSFNSEYAFLIPTSFLTLIIGSTVWGYFVAHTPIAKSVASRFTMPTLNASVFGALFILFVLFGSVLEIGSQGIFISYLLLALGVGVTLFAVALKGKAFTDQTIVICVLAVIIATVTSIIGLPPIVSLSFQIATLLYLFARYARAFTK